jgi:5-methylcytosine-specific restriction endonuclease McrA
MLDHALESWEHPEARGKRAHRVFARDGWRCAVPGCTSYRNLHDHHVRFRSAGGSNALANRVTLCAGHHLRGVHAGVLRISGRAPERLRFELGVRPGLRSAAPRCARLQRLRAC